ncbi:transposase (plasmid) [Vibrio alginolyticus]
MNDLKHTDFLSLTEQQKSVQMRKCLLALALFQEGYSRTQISEDLKVSRTSVNSWVKAYLSKGLEGLQEKPRSGRPMLLDSTQQKLLSQYIEQNTSKSTGKRLTGPDIHNYIKLKFGKDCHPDYILLKKLGCSWIIYRKKKCRL